MALMAHMDANGLATAEPTKTGKDRWMEIVVALAEKSLLSKAQTWYVGANVEGKSRGLTMFTRGFAKYGEHCAAAADGYQELIFEPVAELVES